jgi:hypothetical protein
MTTSTVPRREVPLVFLLTAGRGISPRGKRGEMGEESLARFATLRDIEKDGYDTPMKIINPAMQPRVAMLKL